MFHWVANILSASWKSYIWRMSLSRTWETCLWNVCIKKVGPLSLSLCGRIGAWIDKCQFAKADDVVTLANLSPYVFLYFFTSSHWSKNLSAVLLFLRSSDQPLLPIAIVFITVFLACLSCSVQFFLFSAKMIFGRNYKKCICLSRISQNINTVKLGVCKK